MERVLLTGADSAVGRALAKDGAEQNCQIETLEHGAAISGPAPVLLHALPHSCSTATTDARELAVLKAECIRVAQEARDAGVQCLVLLSSILVYGPHAKPLASEDTPPAPATPYAEMLVELEQEILSLGDHHSDTPIASSTTSSSASASASKSPGMAVIVFRLGDVYGPGAELVEAPARLWAQGMGYFPADGVANVLYTHNISFAVALAISRQRNPAVRGHIFNLTDSSNGVRWGEFWLVVWEAVGIDQPRLEPSFWPTGWTLAIARYAALLSALRYIPRTEYTRSRLLEWSRAHPVAVDKLRKTLGYLPTHHFIDAVAQVQEYYHEHPLELASGAAKDKPQPLRAVSAFRLFLPLVVFVVVLVLAIAIPTIRFVSPVFRK